ncbi:CHAP domain-containing protein [Pedobacter aquae]|uniref:CHAP domain-containing protein n=1 Tax=Pedobacter aquae TaxID=2605747 RepID=A0A5C0VFQ2_9SPHI|nr:CHAP domain-containing protein [Pedobacter aquae]QEK50703.1 CHAP domain-containing protein [Pedobacter aquae]
MATIRIISIFFYFALTYSYSLFTGNAVGHQSTSWSLNQASAKRLKLLEVYRKEIGTKEKSNRNDGSQVESYLKYTGHNKGAPWCAAFVSWCLGQAAINNPRTAWSPALLPAKRIIWKNTWQKEKTQPQAGDVFGIWYASKKRIAHCGFIDAWGESIVITVEGNTNEAGSREGDGVYRKRRLKRTLYAVADWITERRESI